MSITSQNERNVLAKQRVHELAKELGLTNKECMDICDALGYGVKSHSSSLDDAYADGVRRRAKRDGLIREQQPEDPAATKKAAAKKAPATKAPAKKAVAKKTPAKKAAIQTDAATESHEETAPEPATGVHVASANEASSAPELKSTAPKAPESTRPDAESAAVTAEPTPHVDAPLIAGRAQEPAMPKTAAPSQSSPAAPAPTEASGPPKKVISSKPSPAQPVAAKPAAVNPAAAKTVPSQPAPAQPAPAQPVVAVSPEAAKAEVVQTENLQAENEASDTAASADASGGVATSSSAPVSSSGKLIPPPPGPPRSLTGKPIPPPPGLGGRGPAPAGRGPSGPGRTAGDSNRPGSTSGGPSTGGGYNRPAGGGFSAPGSTPGGGPGAAPGGGRPGGGRPGGPQQRPPRRKGRRRRNREELQPMDIPTYTPASAPVPQGVVVIERGSTPQDLSAKLNRTAADVVRFLLQQGEMVTATQSLPDEMIELFATEVGAEISLVDLGQEQEVELQKILEVPEDDEENYESWPTRAPVITVMGHVDHGKTKLLDKIRDANVVAGEAGGITQHIGAYQVEKHGKSLTFIDTPGHEAFTAMRARGAEATDIVVLVVAADDGVMPQTIEAIAHARAAEVPIVVAMNKIDREGADPNRVLQQLAEHELVPESWGGDTVVVQVSALLGTGIDELLETLLLVAEVEDLRGSPIGRARGVVLEAHLDVGRGPVASILVQHGTLHVGDPLVAGPAWGRIRALINDHGEQVPEALPGTPVEVLGLSDIAFAGDDFIVAPDERKARSVAETRERWHRDVARGRDSSVSLQGARLEDIFAQISAGEQTNLNLIVKADAQGSLEALTESLHKLERPEVKVAFVLRGVGGISESDIALAATSDATLIGFNVRPSRQARDLAAAEGVEIRTYEVIYKLLDDVDSAMIGMLDPEYEEVVTGDAEVREVFKVPKIGSVAGCLVQSGVITRNSKVRFLRDGNILWKGEVSSLRRFKDDVREVSSGYECGVGLSDFQDLKSGDIIETFELREIPRK